MDLTQKTTVVVSAVGLLASCVMALRVLWRHRRSLATGTDPLQPHRFTRRRITISVILAAVSVLLSLGVCVIDRPLSASPGAFTWFWLGVLGLLGWLLALAIFDMFAVTHVRWIRREPPDHWPRG
jgi:magnesium-transporting ATPase (P-type)